MFAGDNELLWHVWKESGGHNWIDFRRDPSWNQFKWRLKFDDTEHSNQLLNTLWISYFFQGVPITFNPFAIKWKWWLWCLLWCWKQVHSKIPKVLQTLFRPSLLWVSTSLNISEGNQKKNLQQPEMLPLKRSERLECENIPESCAQSRQRHSPCPRIFELNNTLLFTRS